MRYGATFTALPLRSGDQTTDVIGRHQVGPPVIEDRDDAVLIVGVAVNSHRSDPVRQHQPFDTRSTPGTETVTTGHQEQLSTGGHHHRAQAGGEFTQGQAADRCRQGDHLRITQQRPPAVREDEQPVAPVGPDRDDLRPEAGARP